MEPMCLTHSPVAVSQMLTVLSKEPVRIWSPVVLKLTQITSAEWPCVCQQYSSLPLSLPPSLLSLTHSECALLYTSFHAPEFGSGVHTARGYQRTGGIETKAHDLPRMATERVETLATLRTPQLRERD